MKNLEKIIKFLPLGSLYFLTLALTKEFAFFDFFGLKPYHFLNLSELIFRNITILIGSIVFIVVGFAVEAINHKIDGTYGSIDELNEDIKDFNLIERLNVYKNMLLLPAIITMVGGYFALASMEGFLANTQIILILTVWLIPFLAIPIYSELGFVFSSLENPFPKSFLLYVVFIPATYILMIHNGYSKAREWKQNETTFLVKTTDSQIYDEHYRIITVTNNSLILREYRNGDLTIIPRDQIQLFLPKEISKRPELNEKSSR